jgi:hypothetical protein
MPPAQHAPALALPDALVKPLLQRLVSARLLQRSGRFQLAGAAAVSVSNDVESNLHFASG